MSRSLAPLKVPARNNAAAVSIAMAMILMSPSASPLMASRAASLASAWITALPPAALGSMMASGRAGTTASRSASMRPLDDPLTRTIRRGRVGRVATDAMNAAACVRASDLRSATTESFQIDDHRIGAAAECLLELAAAVAGDEQERAHQRGRIRIKACRRHSATSLSSWL